MYPFGVGAALRQPAPRDHISTYSKQEDIRKRKEMKKRARETGVKKKKQSTEYRETECCPSAIVQRAAWRKKGCMSGVSGVIGALVKTKNEIGDRTNTLRRLLIGGVCFRFRGQTSIFYHPKSIQNLSFLA